MKIAIVGYSGSGKSTLARRLAEYYQLDVLHFDVVQFQPNWVVRNSEEKERITKEFMDTHESWVIDGNYTKLSFDRRMKEADIILILLFNRWACLHRVVKRYRKFKNTTRPDMGEGCPEKLDAEFIRWVLFDGRKKNTRKRYLNLKTEYPEKATVLRNQKQVDNWLKKQGIHS